MNQNEEKNVKSNKSKRFIYFILVIAILSAAAIWKLSTVTKGPKPLTEKQLNLIIQQEKPLIDKFNKKDFQAYEKAKAALTEDINQIFLDFKNKKKADDDLRETIASNPNIPGDYIKILSYTKARAGVASNPNTPLQIIERLSNDADEKVRANIAGNTTTPTKILEMLSSDDEEKVRVKLASNPNTPPDLLLKLYNENHSDINLSLAGNPNTPDAVLIKFLQGEGGGILSGCDLLASVIANPKIDKDVLKKNVNHGSLCIRMGVALNPNVSPEILNILSKDKEKLVREAVVKNTNTPSDILDYIITHEKDGWLPTPRDYAFSNPNIPIDLLSEYSQKDDYEIRKNIASNPSLPADVLRELFNKDDRAINRILAGNPACPTETLSKLSKQKYARKYVADNSRCPAEILISLLNSPDNDAGVEGFVDEISGFWGINPTLIMKWAKSKVGKDEDAELKEYIQMVFADNLFTPEELAERIKEIYLKNISPLQNDLEANLNEMLVELSNDLTDNPKLMDLQLSIDTGSFDSIFKQSLDKIPLELERLTTKAITDFGLYSLIQIIYPIVIHGVKKVAASRAMYAAAASISNSSSSGITKAITWGTQIALVTGGIAIDIYKENQFKEKINNELDKIKANILLGTDQNEGMIKNINLAVEIYTEKKNKILPEALKNAVLAAN
jgi:hypothetical protein